MTTLPTPSNSNLQPTNPSSTIRSTSPPTSRPYIPTNTNPPSTNTPPIQSTSPSTSRPYIPTNTNPPSTNTPPIQSNPEPIYYGLGSDLFGLTDPKTQWLFHVPLCGFTTSQFNNINNFLNIRSVSNRQKSLIWVLNIKEYNFIPDNSKEAKIGVSFTFCYPLCSCTIANNSVTQKGAHIESYSINTPNPSDLLNSFAEPPFLTIAELEFQKKGTRLVQLYNMDEVLNYTGGTA